MKRIVTLALSAACLICLLALSAVAQTARPLTNKDVIAMVDSGLSPELIVAVMKKRPGEYDTSPEALAKLKKAGVPDSVLMTMLGGEPPADVSPPPVKSRRITDELTTSFRHLQNSVVTVWSEFGHGTGFIVDGAGLVLTNQHVVGPAEYIAVQFDARRKIPARLLASDPEKDVAVLWVNLDALPEATAAKIADTAGEEPPTVEGERVLTIGSPLNQRKIMTTGIVSKVERRAIISDVNINPGNSGGPLFNSLGEVVGITTFGDAASRGPGVSGILRIEEALPLLEKAKRLAKNSRKPEARLLPVDPVNPFPIEAVKAVATARNFDLSRYVFGVGEFDVLMMTPSLKYRLATEAQREAMKTRNKRLDKDGAVAGSYRPFEGFHEWAEYVGEYKPVLLVRATPEAGESFWGSLGRAFALSQGVYVRPTVRYKTDFYRMRLMCGDAEVEPIHPGRIALLLSQNNYFVRAQDATYQGLYAYPADAVTSRCGTVRLEVYSERNPEKARTKELDEKAVAKIEEDFAPYFREYGRPERGPRTTTGRPPVITTPRKNTEWHKMP